MDCFDDVRNHSDNITNKSLPVFGSQWPRGIISTLKSVTHHLDMCTCYLGIPSVDLCINVSYSLLYSDLLNRFVTYKAFILCSLVESSWFAVWFFKSLRCF